MSELLITGLGSLLPLGGDPPEVLTALEAGRRGVGPVPETEVPGCTGWAARVESFDPSPYLPPMRARRLDRASLLAVAAASQALRQAGLTGSAEIAHELGVLVGTSSAGTGPLTTFLTALFRQSPEAAPPFEFPNTVANAPASHISIELGLKGVNTTLAHSEAVVGQALLLGRLMLHDERCSRLLVGAVDEWSPYSQAGYLQLGALRRAPAGGGGTLLGEGAVMMVLEPARAAASRDAPALARLAGLAVGSCPGEPYRWLPDAPTLARTVRAALAEAGREPSEIGSVFLAANGVEAMEEAEAEALATVFRGHQLVATGLKGALGERAVAGAASVALAALARQRGRLPPFAGSGLASWPKELRLLDEAAILPPGATLVVLHGFGGNYAAVVLD